MRPPRPLYPWHPWLRPSRIAAACLALGLVGCGPSVDRETAPEPAVATGLGERVVAHDRLGPITLAEVDGYLLSRPVERRWNPEASPEEWYAGNTRQLAIERLLYDEAVLSGVDQEPEFRQRERAILRNATSQYVLTTQGQAQAAISEEDLQEFYELHRERFERPERREVFHLFRRISDPETRDAVVAEIGALRARLVAGEPIEVLARQHSDSETRHLDGRLGVVPQGQFPPDFDAVVFDLAPNTPSDVVITADGAHVFVVRSILEARDLPLEEVRGLIVREIAASRQLDHLASAAAAVAPEGSEVPDRKTLAELLRTAGPATTLLQVGDFELQATGFRRLVAEQRRALGPRQPADLPFRMLEEIHHREVLYQHARDEERPADLDRAIEAERRATLVELYTQRKLRAHLEQAPERIQTHYRDNRMRFASPVRVHLQRLQVPLVEASETMATLEAARGELDAGEGRLEALAESLGGSVQDLGLVTAAQLRANDPAALRFAFLLEVGQHSPPYRLADGLAMLRVDARRDAEPQALARVRDRVVADYLANYQSQLYREVGAALLEESGFELDTAALEGIGPLLGSS